MGNSSTPDDAGSDYSNDWFRTEFEALYKKVEGYVNVFYCQSDILISGKGISPWIDEMPSEFIEYVTLVAESNDSLGSWDRMLLDRKERQYLVMGIFARIFETKIFGELLFGASLSQRDDLEKQEVTLAGNEGFSRTKIRAQAIQKTLDHRRIPPAFQDAVLRLSKQIMILLLPLRQLLRVTYAEAQPIPPIEADYLTGLQDVVKMAGQLSINMRLSPTIFCFNSDRPGNQYNPDDQEDLDNRAYVASKAVAIKKLRDVSNLSDQERSPYRALVKFAVWPSIKRYLPGTGKKNGADRGFRIYTMCKSRVVYHWGLENHADRIEMSLKRFLERNHKERGNRGVHQVGSIQYTAQLAQILLFGAIIWIAIAKG